MKATDLPQRGNPCKLSEQVVTSICQEEIQKPFTTQGELQLEVQADEMEVSKDTISQTHHHVGLYSQTPWKTSSSKNQSCLLFTLKASQGP